MKLGAFIAGVFGTVGLGLSVLAGVFADNSVEAVLTRGLLSGVVCYAVGYGVGLIAQQVAFEHAGHVSKLVAEQDAADEAKRREEEAAKAAQAAEDAVGEAAPGDGADHRAQTGHGDDPAGLEALEVPGGILEQAAHGEADEEHVEELRHVAHDDERDEVLLVLGERPGIDLLEGSHAGGCGRRV